MDVFSRDVKIAEEITRILVLNGAKLNELDSEKLSPLHRAVNKKHIDGVKLIIKINKELKGQDREIFNINLEGGERKYPPIFYALEKKENTIAEMLFINGAKVWIRWNEDYMPREWKKRESNNRRHVLWKMEKFELKFITKRFKFYQYYLNNEEIVK